MKILYIFILLLECCRVAPRAPVNMVENSSQYYILEKQGDNSFAVTRKCGLYSVLSFNDSLFEISYHLSGAWKYRVLKIDSLQNEKVITCDAEYVNVGYIDTTTFVKIYYEKLDPLTTRFIMHITDYKKKIDTIYATRGVFLNDYKLIDLECNKRAQ